MEGINIEYLFEVAMLQEFEMHLAKKERSRETVKKYPRDVRRFFQKWERGGSRIRNNRRKIQYNNKNSEKEKTVRDTTADW